MRNEPKIGTKAPAKVGGTGGGLSKPAVAAATKKAAAPAKAAKPLPRNMRMEVRSRAEALKKT